MQHIDVPHMRIPVPEMEVTHGNGSQRIKGPGAVRK